MAASSTHLAHDRSTSPARKSKGHWLGTISQAIANALFPGEAWQGRRRHSVAASLVTDGTPRSLAASVNDADVLRLTSSTPPPISGVDACAILIGGAAALSMLFEVKGAQDAPSRASLVASPDLHTSVVQLTETAPTTGFTVALRNLDPFWLAASVAVLEHATIASVDPSPETIGGYPLTEVLLAARHVASGAPPFDRIVPCLDLVMHEERCQHAI